MSKPRAPRALLLWLLFFTMSAAHATEEAAPPPVFFEREVIAPVASGKGAEAAQKMPLESEASMGPMASGANVSELLEDAENGTAQVTLNDPTGTATLIQSTVVFEGDYSFHLTNPSRNDTSVELDPGIQVTTDTQLVFATKFGLLTTDQVAKVQVSTDGGSSYGATVWSRAGTGSPSGGFESVEVDLSAYAGQGIHLRFILDFNSGSYYEGTSTSVGWFFDYISIGGTATMPNYSIGEPTDAEQYNLELINRARADALAEADRLIALSSTGGDPDIISAVNSFDINPNDIRTQYEWAINNGHMAASAQPLAFNAKLIEAARLHTQDMLANEFQGHLSSSTPPAEASYPAGASLADRVTASGYSWGSLGESVYAYTDSVIHAHGGFLIDWGDVSNPESATYNPAFAGQGMQNPPGHRLSNHNPNFQEIGIGYIEDSNGTVGPNLVTQDFARPGTGGQFITGVVIADMNNDDFYDMGEGLGGILVTAEPADGSTPRPAYRALTSNSGGYALPVPADGQYTVSFSHSMYGSASANCTLSDGENFKVDWIPEILYTAEFGDASAPPGKLELRFFDAGIDGTPRLQTTSDLSAGFTDENSATLSTREASGHRTFQYDKPATLNHFSRVVVE